MLDDRTQERKKWYVENGLKVIRTIETKEPKALCPKLESKYWRTIDGLDSGRTNLKQCAEILLQFNNILYSIINRPITKEIQ